MSEAKLSETEVSSFIRVAPIDGPVPGEITFLTNPRYQRFLPQCRASAVIVGPGVVERKRLKRRDLNIYRDRGSVRRLRKNSSTLFIPRRNSAAI